MNQNRAKRIGKDIGGALAHRFGPRRRYCRSEIARACEERGYSVADDLLMAIVLFGPVDMAAEITAALALDFSPDQIIDDAGGLFALDSEFDDLFGDGL